MQFFTRVWAKLRPIVQFNVRHWHVAMGGWLEADARLIIVCEEDIWYWRLAEFLSWDVLTRCCDFLHCITLPKFILNWERAWDEDEPETLYRWEDWFGDDIGCVFHCYVESPIFDWVWKHKNRQTVQFEMTLDEARKKFAHKPEHYEWMEKEIERHKQWDAESAAEKEAESS